ncbi:hypothetical protein HPP92_016521 [Vanilla planifolia]|uniref:HTH myb-type domain-containing protein n=1 Tax=Vanilla planifolia TaxID=51239 RepID=A0A835QK88_VANPL|nr:hypothetical protein HPP92_017143 [Vanilla planifolia]KAG0471975.1 hypothetical protein HPP92_016521 [Vanilla planifolia]
MGKAPAVTKANGLKRCGKSCRLRWLNYSRPNIRHGGSFTEEEDQDYMQPLYKYWKQLLLARWSIIAASFLDEQTTTSRTIETPGFEEGSGARRDNHLPRNRPPLPPWGVEPYRTAAKPSASAMERLQLHMQLTGLNPPSTTSLFSRSKIPNPNDRCGCNHCLAHPTAKPAMFGVPTCSFFPRARTPMSTSMTWCMERKNEP